jgi:PAS domain S-box-containing protein
MPTRLLRRGPITFVLAAAVLCTAILATGVISYRRYEADFRKRAELHLRTVGEMKVAELQAWRTERLADASFFLENAAFISLLRRYTRPGGDAAAQYELEDWMRRMLGYQRYDRISAHGVDGHELLVVSTGVFSSDDHMRNAVTRALSTGQVEFLDIHNDEAGRAHLAVIAPVREGGQPVGAVVLRIDPTAALFPLMSRWPVPTETSRTLVVRREGAEVVVLNPQPDPTGAATGMRAPTTRSDLPIVRVATGEQGLIEAGDDRGEPVLAILLAVPGAPWFLVASTSSHEVFGPLRERAWLTVIVVGTLLLSAIVLIVLAWRNVSARVATNERRHLEALTAMSQVVEASPVVVFQWLATEGWPVEWVSSNVARWGYSAEKLMRGDPPFKQLLHPEDEAVVAEEVERYITEGRDAFTQEYRIVAANGAAMWMEDRTTVVRDADGRVVRFQGVLTDITERRHLQAQFVQAQKMETVGRLAGGVAHDFNNLLTVINGYAEFALAEVPPDSPVREMLEEIHDAGARASALTRQLLSFSRRQQAQLVVLDCNAVAERMRKLLARLIGEDVQVAFDLAPELCAVRADEGQIEQIIMNLAINARDAMPEGGTLTVSTRNVVLGADERDMSPAVAAGHYVLLSVSDTGCGIDDATRERIFEPFFTTKAAGHGTGLGLSMVHGFVTARSGSVRVRSVVGQGTTFEVYLPIADVPHGCPDEPVALASVMPGRETILLVEDEVALRRVAERILLSAGYTVICAGNAGEALAQLEAHPQVDLVLTDVVMPGMSGHDLAREIIRRRPKIRVLLASGYARDAFPHRAPQGEGFTFIAKPYSPGTLTQQVRDALDRKVTEQR